MKNSGNSAKGTGLGFVWCTVQDFIWRDWGKLQKTLFQDSWSPEPAEYDSGVPPVECDVRYMIMTVGFCHHNSVLWDKAVAFPLQQIQTLQDLRFSQACWWIFKLCRMIPLVDWYIATDVSKAWRPVSLESSNTYTTVAVMALLYVWFLTF